MAKMKMANKKLATNRFSAGSALILTVVLITLLAAVGVVFVMMARVDKIATSAISENRELNFAVETVIAKISQELALDVPGVADPNEEYYDYPGPANRWLASLEPYLERDPDKAEDDIYYWRQISDVTGYINQNWGVAAQQNVPVVPLNLSTTKYVREYPEIRLDLHPVTGELVLVEQSADTDGDGIADAKWIPLYNITSSKGKTIYAAIRIVDNAAMLNVNTACKFDPCEVPLFRERIDGSSQMQINLAGLARFGDDVDTIHTARCDTSDDPNDPNNRNNWNTFENNMLWRIESPASGYLPFDISDELELRYRYCISSRAQTRLESLWNCTVGLDAPIPKVPYGGSSGTLEDWQKCVTDPYDPNHYYYKRHLLTTYNIDRIIAPDCRKMININDETNTVEELEELYRSLLRSIDPAIVGPLRWQTEARFAQLAVNIIDFADRDDINNDGFLDPNCVTTLVDPCGITHYGFEAQPFITEIGMKSKPGSIYCAVELYNPFSERINLSDFEIELIYEEPNSTDTVLTVSFGSGDIIERDGYFVVANRLSEFDIYPRTRARQDRRLRFFGNWQPPGGRKPPIVGGPDRKPPTLTTRPVGDGIVFLRRRVVSTGEWIYVDRQVVDPNWVPRDDERYFGRDDRGWHVIYQILAEDVSNSYGSLGRRNLVDLAELSGHNFSFYLPNPTIKPPYPTMEPQTYTKLLTVGDITRILTIGHGTSPDSTIGEKLWEIGQLWEADKKEEYKVRLNLQDPNHRNVFQYLTVFDPSTDDIDNDNDGFKDVDDTFSPEWKIPGRININTAPWYVIAQLPWMRPEIAQAIVAYRDKLRLPVDYRQSATIEPAPDSRFLATNIFGLREDPGFASIGELNFVIAGDYNYRIEGYRLDNIDLGCEFIGHPGFPDLTTDGLGLGDGVVDDFEERDIIFSRISNLVTVRSDVFTAYILVRIGTDGPQKRVIAILDRSDVYSGKDKVRLVALHYVPDPR